MESADGLSALSGDAAPNRESKESYNREAYDAISENPFLATLQNPLSTFSIDVDTASYANVRRFLRNRQTPPRGAVRIEELVNYFPYDYPQPAGDSPLAISVEVAECPWNSEHQLARIALKARDIPAEKRPLSNLVFLLDVSGSMQDSNKLPLVKSAMKMLVDRLGENDRVALVVYAGASGLVLPSTSGLKKPAILAALDQLTAGGSTNGGEGIRLAYDVARDYFIEGGINRVILCTDGDFNMGTTSQSELIRLIETEAKRKSGVFLSVLGVGTGNYQDSTMEKLADRGNGNYAYLDSLPEARKVLVEQISGTLVTVAKDVKIQVDFNPAAVGTYRLLGYENRMLRAEDFTNDKKDAGEVGAGHCVTAFYELTSPQQPVAGTDVEPTKYQTLPELTDAARGRDELFTVRLRYKEPDAAESQQLQVAARNQRNAFDKASPDFQFAAAVVEFGMLLRDSEHRGAASWQHVLQTAQESIAAKQFDETSGRYRNEFLELARLAAEQKDGESELP